MTLLPKDVIFSLLVRKHRSFTILPVSVVDMSRVHIHVNIVFTLKKNCLNYYTSGQMLGLWMQGKHGMAMIFYFYFFKKGDCFPNPYFFFSYITFLGSNPFVKKDDKLSICTLYLKCIIHI